MRDFSRVDGWLEELLDDTYPQPPDEGHTQMALEAINNGIQHLTMICKSVLDVGCGATGFVAPMFAAYGVTEYAGVAVRGDAEAAKKTDLKIYDADFTFLNMIPDKSYDIVFARHSLEHSPMPILSLFEWARIARKYVWLILPNPDYWGWAGRNHYSVMKEEQAIFLLERVGLTLVWDYRNDHEIWLISQKKEPKSETISGPFNK